MVLKMINSETEEVNFKKNRHHLSNLEKNCNQIFVKTPALTRDIIEKVQNSDIGKDSTRIMGYQIETRQFWVIAGLLLLFLLSFIGLVAMWFTNAFDNAVFSNLAIAEDSTVFQMWKKPSPKPLFKMYIFNYTNVPEYENGDVEKLHVQEVGPYVYEHSLERINIKFNNTQVSYQEERSYKFMPDLSIGHKQNDRVIVPNIPMLAAAAVNKHSSFIMRMGVSSLLNTLNASPFLNLPAHRFITGYEDNLYSLSKSFLKLQNKKLYEHYGLVASNIGVHDDVFVVNTGVEDINKVGQVEGFNGDASLHHWSTDECNSLAGATDGSMFSPKQVRNRQPVSFYLKEMCRTLPLHFEEEVKILNGRIPAYRYTLPYNVFDSPELTPSNQCFCNLDLGECPPQGVFNATPCAFGAPAFVSFPHFYKGDALLRDAVTGLTEHPPHHKTYIDLHPTLGFAMAGKTRFQFNIQVVKSFGMTQLDMFEDGLMLPVAWFELTLEDKTLPDDMVGIIFQTTFTVKSVELGLKYGSLLMVVVTFLSVVLVLRNGWYSRRVRTMSLRPLQRRHDNNGGV